MAPTEAISLPGANAGLKTIRITFTQNVGPALAPGGSGSAAGGDEEYAAEPKPDAEK
jgi:hypothetical protein